MSMRSFVVEVLLAVLMAVAAPAGEIKTHSWPCELVSQEITTIPVVMDVGYWVEIVTDDIAIKLTQTSSSTYSGCADLEVRCNISVKVSCSIKSTGEVSGSYSTSISGGSSVSMPGGTVTVCAKLKSPSFTKQPVGTTDVHVATITLKVTPLSL